MQALIDPTLLGDALVILRTRVLPARLRLHEGHLVRSVAVDLVRAHEAKDCFRSVPTGRLEQVQSADRIDVEIVQRDRCRAVMGRLSSTMDDEIERMGAK